MSKIYSVNLTDLSYVFLPLSKGTKRTSAINFRYKNIDLSEIFATYIYGTNTNIPTQSYLQLNKMDLTSIFQPYKDFTKFTLLTGSNGYIDGSNNYWTSGCSISQTGQYAVIAIFNTSGSSGKVYNTNNYGVNWYLSTVNNIPTGRTLNPRGIKMTPSGEHSIFVNVFSQTNDDVYYSSNFGTTFNKTTADLPTTYFMNNIVISSNGTNVLVVTPINKNIYLSTNSGTSWQTIEITSANINYNNICTESSFTTFYSTTSSGVYKSTNGGSIWTSITISNVPTNTTWKGCAMSSDGVIIVLGVYGGGVYLSRNSGSSFNLISDLPNNANWNSIAITYDGSTIIASRSDSNILYISYNAGIKWITDETSISTSYYVDTCAIQNKLLLVTTIQTGAGYLNSSNVYKSFY